MSQEIMDNSPSVEEHEVTWRVLNILGGIAALLAVLFFRRNFGVELVQFKGFGIIPGVPAEAPLQAGDWFTLLNTNPLIGLALLGLIDLVNYALVGLIFLALLGALIKINKSAVVVATAAALIGIAVFYASNQAFAMLNLSGKFAAATSEEQRTMLLSAGEALLAINNPALIYQGTGFYISLLLVLMAGLIDSVVMLQGDRLGKITAWIGITANGIGLFYFIFLVFLQDILWLPHSLSAPFRMAWYILISIKLFKLSKGEKWTGYGTDNEGI
jgi:hypothetical protein